MRWGRLLVENHRGALVPRVLGIALAIDAVVWTVVVATFADVGAAGWGRSPVSCSCSASA